MKGNKCKQCGEIPSEFEYYSTLDEKYIFCSEDCCEDFYEEHKEYDIFKDINICPGYYACKKFDNIRNMCIHTYCLRFGKAKYKNKMNFSNSIPKGEWCSPAEVSIIKSNIKLFDFVKKTEDESSKLNKETLIHTRVNTILAVAMLFTSVINLVLLF